MTTTDNHEVKAMATTREIIEAVVGEDGRAPAVCDARNALAKLEQALTGATNDLDVAPLGDDDRQAFWGKYAELEQELSFAHATLDVAEFDHLWGWSPERIKGVEVKIRGVTERVEDLKKAIAAVRLEQEARL